METKKETKHTKSFPILNQQYSLNINVISDEIEFQYHEEATVTVEANRIAWFENNIVSCDGEAFVIKPKSKDSFFSKFSSSHSGLIIITLPKNVTIDSVVFLSVSGDVHFPQLKTIKAEISTVSGDIAIDDLIAETVKIDTVSGDIEIKELTCDLLTFDSVSGDLDINKLFAREGNISLVSGDVNIESSGAGILYVKTLSGDANIKGSAEVKYEGVDFKYGINKAAKKIKNIFK